MEASFHPARDASLSCAFALRKRDLTEELTDWLPADGRCTICFTAVSGVSCERSARGCCKLTRYSRALFLLSLLARRLGSELAY